MDPNTIDPFGLLSLSLASMSALMFTFITCYFVLAYTHTHSHTSYAGGNWKLTERKEILLLGKVFQEKTNYNPKTSVTIYAG